MCIARNPSKCPNTDENEDEYVYQSLLCSYNCVEDCDEISNLGLADVSYMSGFKYVDEIVTYGKYIFHDRIIDDFSMLTIDSITADNYENTLGADTNELENDTGAYTNI